MIEHKPGVNRTDVRPDLADRMAKSLQLSGLSVHAMSELLECHRNTIGGWLNRRNKPFPATLQRWAEITGVPYEWLRDGHWPPGWPAASSQVTDG
jgi:transcriptional regulator with XRE-family HTH domain